MSRLVVFDIDDTLFDWLNMWSSSFSEFLSAVGRLASLDDASVRRTIRTFHQSVGTSEFPFSYVDLKSLFPKLSEEDSEALAVDLSNSRRKGHHIFEGVTELFIRMKGAGDTLVLHTDAPAAIAAVRCEALGIDSLVNAVYATKNDRFPNKDIRPIACDVVTIPERKPDPRALQFIIAQGGSAQGRTVYVGDSLFRDIAMAKKCGVSDVYAKYGCDREGDAYNLLRAVSHWTQEDVESERLLAQETVLPSSTADTVADLSTILLGPT